MDRRTALQALLVLMAQAAIGHATEKEPEDELGQFVIQIPEIVRFDLTGVKEMRIAYEDRTVIVRICEMINALSEGSGMPVYTLGNDLCK
jgi:hypothetical protein